MSSQQPIRSPFPDVVIPNLSVHDFLFADLTADELSRTAVTAAGADTGLTYGELLEQIDRVAGALAARGIAPGDVVALHSPNSPAFVALFHGILRAGATVTTVNSLYTGEEIGRQLARLRGAARDHGGRAAREHAGGRAAAGVEDVVVADAPGTTASPTGSPRAAPPPDVSIDPATHLAVLPYSSGTTGWPRASCSRTATSSRTSRRPSASSRSTRTTGRGRAAVLPHLRHDRAAQPLALRARAARDVPAVRPRAVPRRDRASSAARTCSSRRRSRSRWPSTRWSSEHDLCERPHDPVRRRAPGRRAGRCGRGRGSAAGWCRATA